MMMHRLDLNDDGLVQPGELRTSLQQAFQNESQEVLLILEALQHITLSPQGGITLQSFNEFAHSHESFITLLEKAFFTLHFQEALEAAHE